jgi:hypothetical protein
LANESTAIAAVGRLSRFHGASEVNRRRAVAVAVVAAPAARGAETGNPTSSGALAAPRAPSAVRNRSRSSAAEANRSSGSLAMARSMAASMPCGSPARSSLAGIGSRVRMARAMSA